MVSPDPPMLIPAVSLKEGAVVVVRNGDYEPVEDERGQPFALDEFIEVFLKAYKAVLVFDIDGIEGGGAQFDEVDRAAGGSAEVWWDGGAQREEDVINLITSGADRAVVATRTLAGLDELSAAAEVTENLVFEVVARGNAVVGEKRAFGGRTVEEVARLGLKAGAEDLLLLDPTRPLGHPVDWDIVRAASRGWKRVFVGGGIDAAAPWGASGRGAPVAGAVVDLISVLGPYL